MKPQERLVEAMKGAKKVHPDFEKHVPIELGLSIAWQNVPWQLGGWADDWSCEKGKTIPEVLLKPEGHFWVAGDQVSYLSGWQEGAVRSAHHVIARIAGVPEARPLLKGAEPRGSIRKAPSTRRRTRGCMHLQNGRRSSWLAADEHRSLPRVARQWQSTIQTWYGSDKAGRPCSRRLRGRRLRGLDFERHRAPRCVRRR